MQHIMSAGIALPAPWPWGLSTLGAQKLQKLLISSIASQSSKLYGVTSAQIFPDFAITACLMSMQCQRNLRTSFESLISPRCAHVWTASWHGIFFVEPTWPVCIRSGPFLPPAIFYGPLQPDLV